MGIEASARTAYRAFDDNGNFLGNWDREENLMWGGFNPQNPNETTDPWYIVDPNWHGNKTWEIIASLEREVFTDFMIGADLIWRKYSDWWINRDYSDYFGGTLLARTDYVKAPNEVPESYTAPDGTVVDLGDAAGRPFYVWREGVNDVYGWYASNTPSDYYDQYLGLNVRIVKRLSHRWMLDGSFTWQSQKNYWGEAWPLDPTNQWALDGQTYAYVVGGGSGKSPVSMFSRWMVKAQGLYQLPLDFNISFNFNAREGHILPTQLGVQDYSSSNPYSTGTTMYTKLFGQERLPVFWALNVRLEKILRIGDRGRIYLMVDAFNIFNQLILNRKRDINPGTIYLHNSPPTFSENARSGEPNELLNPRIFRFGVRFQF